MRRLQILKSEARVLLIFAICMVAGHQLAAQNTDGGMVQTEDGMTNVEVCINNQPSVISFDSTGVSGNNFRYIITDANDNVLNVKADDQQNFNPAGAGECHVWGIAYDGTLQNTSSGTPVTQVSATNGDSLSRNFITVNRSAPNGGMVQTENGQDTARIFIDNTTSVVDFDSTGVNGNNFRYIITNQNREVLRVKTADQQNFNPAGEGVCYVYGIAYTGNLQNTSQGTPIRNVSASGCDSLSRNFVTVIRKATDGGMVQTEDGEDTVEVCINNSASVIGFDSLDAQGNNFRYIITDENRELLRVKSGDQQNFNPAGAGVCYVYGISYTGSLQNTSQGTPVTNVSSSDGDSLSRNFITVMRDTLDGGQVQTSNGMDSVEVMINGQSSVINFTTTSKSKDKNYTFIITDNTDTILNPDAGTSQNFEPAGTGVCYVYGVAHQGSLTAMQGMSISDIAASKCLDRSENPLVVNRVKTTGIATFKNTNQSVDAYPNPAVNQVNITFKSETQGSAQVRITDLTGRTVKANQVKVNQGRNRLSVDLRPDMQGLYLITIEQADQSYQQKLLVR